MCFSFKSEIDINQLKTETGAALAQRSFDLFQENNAEGFLETVFPNAWSVALISTKHGPTLLPMRYRLRPQDSSEEVPVKYNLYNARVESLESKKTWSRLLSRNHVAIPMKAFNEWVPTEKGKRIVQFSLESSSTFWCAGLFDIWENPEDKTKLVSFAIITCPPTEYISNIGHDRCPVIIDKQEALKWIEVKGNPELAINFLPKDMDRLDFKHEFITL